MLLTRSAARPLVSVAVATLLAGCAIGPNYKRPAAAVTESFKNPVNTTAPALPPDKWWTLFNDSVLNDLEAQVVVNNQNIAEASAAYMQARAVVRQDRSNLLPSFDLSGGATRTASGPGSFGTSLPGTLANTTTTSTSYQLAASTDWQLDIWGKLRRTLENARDSAQASAADLANAELSNQSQLATAYLQLRGADWQRKLLSDTQQAYQRTLTITQNKYKAGVSARTDVLQAQSQLFSAQDQEQSEILQRDQLENAIAALIVYRFGLIPLACAIFTINMLLNVPFTSDFSAWYMTTSALALLSVVALAGWGFYHSLGGEPLWRAEIE